MRTHLVVPLLLVALASPLAARAAEPTAAAPTTAAPAERRVLLLDVRTPGEFTDGHLEGALNVPVDELAAKLSTLPVGKGDKVVLYCRSGRRSAIAAKLLREAGFTDVTDHGPMERVPKDWAK